LVTKKKSRNSGLTCNFINKLILSPIHLIVEIKIKAKVV